MLYLIHGKDSFRGREKLNELVDFFKKKIIGASMSALSGENFDIAETEELFKTQTLFGGRRVVVCENFFEFSEAADFTKNNLENFSKSNNIFIFLEGELDNEIVSLFKKHSQKIQEFKLLSGTALKKWIQNREDKIPFDVQEEIINSCGSDLWRVSKEIDKWQLGGALKKSLQKEKYNPFAICDAIAEKNGSRAWILFQRAVFAGAPAEEVFYKVVWQVKNLLLIKKLSNVPKIDIAKESGLHPFVARKTIYASQFFTEKELDDFSFALVKLYHNTRKGLTDLSSGLERLLLGF